MKHYKIKVMALTFSEESGINETIFLSSNKGLTVGQITKEVKTRYENFTVFTILVEEIHESRNI